ncbi:hypothetical protein [Caballeronia zhejiangensis]|uniref:gp53-like domain-containing protein n=1 Tax=Caballeronia zhejiangensis TaxID=871203 RepID=UPI0006900625|nr:hypothetical protein [Caballeronia zhejiangensis]
MFRIDDPTAATTLPTPEAAGTEGYFTEGNPTSGTPATIVRGSWMNMIQEELRAVVVAGGLTPSKTTYTQVRDAIKAIAIGQFAQTLLTQGYVDFPNGLQIRWGSFTGSASADTPVTFAKAFSTAFRIGLVSGLCSGTGAWGGYNSATQTGMNCNWWQSASTRQAGSGTYFVIGQ